MGCDERPLPDHEVDQTCAEMLVDCVDSARQLLTEAGLRPYRVFLVWVRWTADENADGRVGSNPDDVVTRAEDETDLTAFSEGDLEDETVGVGRPELLLEVEILPTPKVSGMGGVSKDQDSTGLTERGGLTVTEISARFTEDELMGLITPYRREDRPDALKPGIEFWWEVQENRPAGYINPGYTGCEEPQERRQPRRRFHVSSTPNHDASKFQWEVGLARADGERGREGEVEGVVG